MSNCRRQIATTLTLLLLGSTTAWSATRYVSDQLVISLRESPRGDAQVITYVKTDAPLELLGEQGDYVKVRTATGQVGYVPAQYLTDQTPKSTLLSRLEQERDKLAARLAELERQATMSTSQVEQDRQRLAKELETVRSELTQVREDLGRLGAELEQTDKAYQALRTSAANVVAVTEERDRLAESNRELTARVETLDAERKSLQQSGGIKWFLAGAGVLLAGWVLGKIPASRRRRSLY